MIFVISFLLSLLCTMKLFITNFSATVQDTILVYGFHGDRDCKIISYLVFLHMYQKSAVPTIRGSH